MNFDSKGMTLEVLSIHENTIEDATSHIVQHNNAAGDFRRVTVAVALCEFPPPLPRPTDDGSFGGRGGGGGRTYIYMYIHIHTYVHTYIHTYMHTYTETYHVSFE